MTMRYKTKVGAITLTIKYVNKGKSYNTLRQQETNRHYSQLCMTTIVKTKSGFTISKGHTKANQTIELELLTQILSRLVHSSVWQVAQYTQLRQPLIEFSRGQSWIVSKFIHNWSSNLSLSEKHWPIQSKTRHMILTKRPMIFHYFLVIDCSRLVNLLKIEAVDVFLIVISMTNNLFANIRCIYQAYKIQACNCWVNITFKDHLLEWNDCFSTHVM